MTTPPVPPIPWSTLMPKLNTGDILSFAGNNSLDYAIQMVEGEPYTHVGMVIRNGQDLWFWDAPGGGTLFYDPVSKNPAQQGARVADLATVINYYMTTGGEVEMWVRQLQPGATPDQQTSLMTFVENADGTPFPGTDLKIPPPWNLGVGFAASWAFGVEENGTIAGTFFCAQLAAQSYMAMGLLPLWPKPANGYDPANFNSLDATVPPLRGGAQLSPTQQVSYP